jgi:DNA-binding NarL/FixJ family response regulator
MEMYNKPIRVMLVDDHTVARSGVRLMLGSASEIQVLGEAANAQEALATVRDQTFDVALVDIAMPGKNGLELLKALKAVQPTLAVLILSTYAEEIYALRALKSGAAGYLTKDSPAATLVAAVRKAAAGGKYVTPFLAERFVGIIGGTDAMSHETLTDRELEVLKLLARGESLVRIGEILHLSPKTVTAYRGRILEKMGFNSNAELTRYAVENGLLA